MENFDEIRTEAEAFKSTVPAPDALSFVSNERRRLVNVVVSGIMDAMRGRENLNCGRKQGRRWTSAGPIKSPGAGSRVSSATRLANRSETSVYLANLAVAVDMPRAHPQSSLTRTPPGRRQGESHDGMQS